MYNQELKHKLKFEILNQVPKITIGIRFNDMFTQDTYVLVSESKKFDKNKIPFSFIINNEKRGTYILNNLDGQTFLNESFSQIEDYDFKEYFTEKIINEISEEIKFYIEDFEKQLLLFEVSYIGELHRMKELSGLKNKFLSEAHEVVTFNQLSELRQKYCSKEGILFQATEDFKALPSVEKKTIGNELINLKKFII